MITVFKISEAVESKPFSFPSEICSDQWEKWRIYIFFYSSLDFLLVFFLLCLNCALAHSHHKFKSKTESISAQKQLCFPRVG